MRLGNSIDFHPFKENRKLILGGIEIPYFKGLDGDSDADPVLHSIAESFLGALALGDLGTYYNKENALNMDSSVILRECYERVINKGYQLENIDTMILIESPNLKPFKELMRQKIAKVLDVDINKISIKATTMEKCGIIGKGEGVLAFSTVLLKEAL